MLSISETDYFQDLDLLQSVIDSLLEGVVLQDRNSRIIGFNKRACQILQLTGEQLLGKTSFDPSWEAVHFNGDEAPGDEHPIMITLRTGKPQHNVIMGVRANSMQVKWLSVNTKLVTAGDEQFAVALFSDISETISVNHRLTAETAKLRASEEKFEQSFRCSAIGKAMVSPQGVIMDANDALCSMLGYAKEELLQFSFPHITHPDDTASDLSLFEKLLHKEISTYEMEKRYIRKNGEIIWAHLHVAPVWDKDSGTLHFVIAQVQEISETKKLNRFLEERNAELLKTQEQLKRKIGQLRDFAGIITHDVRGPAANLKRLLELYENSEEEETRRSSFHYLKKASNDLTGNLNELIQVLQIHLNEHIPYTRCSFTEVTRQVCAQLGSLIEQKQARIDSTWDVAEIFYPRVYLQSILYNLISNSLKYSQEGVRPEIEIKTWMQDGQLYLSVSDNGLGIDLKRYGKSLFQFQKSFHAGFDSKGIGLYLVRNQVENLGGIISAESEVNKGAVFTIRF